MDPLTQGALGAVVALAFRKKDPPIQTIILGALGGMAADLDVLIQSSEDSLMYLQYHRHFSHSLAFVPLGGLLVALALALLRGRPKLWRDFFPAAFFGYATHGLLDACTSYGTLLWWPFSDTRVSWSIIAIIDPLYTGLLLAAIFAAYRKKQKLFIYLFGLSFVYLAIGLIQNQRAEALTRAHLRAQKIKEAFHIDAKPTVLNLWLWRVNYSLPGRHCALAVYNPFWAPTRFYEGTCAPSFGPIDLAQKVPVDSRLANDIRRFSWFSEGVIGYHPENPDFLIDFRYSLIPNSLEPLWGIQLDWNQPQQGVEFITSRNFDVAKREQFFLMLRGK